MKLLVQDIHFSGIAEERWVGTLIHRQRKDSLLPPSCHQMFSSSFTHTPCLSSLIIWGERESLLISDVL